VEKLKALMEQYGPVAFGLYFAIFGFSIVVFAALFSFGFSEAIARTFDLKLEGGAGAVTTLGFAWVATKVIQPLRIILTLGGTPLVAKVLKIEKKSPPVATGAAEVPPQPK
jgi:hypothetical protein